MSMSIRSAFSACGVLLVLIASLLQLVTLTTTWWASFEARTDLGKPKEDGHYGLWTICFTKGPHWTEDCDPLDTFFQTPPYLQVSGILGIIHLLVLLTLIPLVSLKAIQVMRNERSLCLQEKILCIINVTFAFVSAIFSILVIIFATVNKSGQNEYTVQNGWSFWIQIFIVVVDVLVTAICAMEVFKYRQFYMNQNIDPEGRHAETYGNPTFDADSPEPIRRQHLDNLDNGVIAYTESSGYPYNPHIPTTNPPQNNQGNLQSNRKKSEVEFHIQSNLTKDCFNTISYENESYQEHSPNSKRMQRK